MVRRKLLRFLKASEHYTAESVITSFPNDGGCMGRNEWIGRDFTSSYFTPNSLSLITAVSGLFEEHALLMGRLGRHEVALAIYAHILKDQNLALR